MCGAVLLRFSIKSGVNLLRFPINWALKLLRFPLLEAKSHVSRDEKFVVLHFQILGVDNVASAYTLAERVVKSVERGGGIPFC